MEDGALEFKKYSRLFLAWWWLIVLGALVGGVASYLVIAVILPPSYESTARVIVERFAQPGSLSLGDTLASERLAASYAQLVETRPILEGVREKLLEDYGIRKLPEKKNFEVSTTLTNGLPSNVIRIKVKDRDPVIASIIANTTADTFIKTLLDRQLSQLIRFRDVLSEYRITQDVNTVANQAASAGILSVVEPAVPAPQPANRKLWKIILITAVGAVTGLWITGLAVVLREYLDDRFRSPDELKTVAGLAPLALIPRYRGRNGPRIDSLGLSHRIGPFAESYRFLVANLDFASHDKQGIKTVLVTGPGISEGKTTTAVNLAITAAKGGKTTILVDSDLRSPSLHQVFDLNEHKGLSQLLTGDGILDEALASTSIEGLCILASGPMLPDPGVALSSPAMNALVQELKKRADLVIFDSPSLLAVTDAILLASRVDAVLLVVDASRTSRQVVEQATDHLRRSDANVVGGVLNKVSGGGQVDRYLRHYSKYFEKSHQ